MKLTTEDLSRIISEELEAVLDEKKGSKRQRKKKAKKKKADDRCTRIAKRKYDVWPSAYASGAVVQCRRGKIWKGLKEEDAHPEVDEIINEEELTDKEKAKLRDILIDQGGAAGLDVGVLPAAFASASSIASVGALNLPSSMRFLHVMYAGH